LDAERDALSAGFLVASRGAVELAMAILLLSLGVFDATMFTVVAGVGPVTTFLAPIGARRVVRSVAVTGCALADERVRPRMGPSLPPAPPSEPDVPLPRSPQTRGRPGQLISRSAPSGPVSQVPDALARPPATPGRPKRPSRGAMVAAGLLLTLVGLFVLGGLLPTAPGALERAVAIAGVGVVALWFGGILLGRSARR
jgi:hypothetical protein